MNTKNWEEQARRNRKEREQIITLARRANSPAMRKNPWAPSYGNIWTEILAEEKAAADYVLALRPDILLRVLGADKRSEGLVKRLQAVGFPRLNVGVVLFMIAMGFSWLVIDPPGTYFCYLLQAMGLTIYSSVLLLRQFHSGRTAGRRDSDLRTIYMGLLILGSFLLGTEATMFGFVMNIDRICEESGTKAISDQSP